MMLIHVILSLLHHPRGQCWGPPLWWCRGKPVGRASGSILQQHLDVSLRKGLGPERIRRGLPPTWFRPSPQQSPRAHEARVWPERWTSSYAGDWCQMQRYQHQPVAVQLPGSSDTHGNVCNGRGGLPTTRYRFIMLPHLISPFFVILRKFVLTLRFCLY